MTTRRILTGLAVTLACALLISLGIWQLQRKAWKEALIADLDNRAHTAPTPLPPTWDPARDEFRHVAVTGTYLNASETHVYGLMDQGGQAVQGSYLFVPFRLDDGTIVLVNRGFVPKGETAIDRVDAVTRVEGILRAPEPRGWFVPENIPAKGQWFTRDSTQIAASLELAPAAPFYIEADARAGASAPWPKGGLTRTITLRNDHLHYALTWFGLAIVLLAVTGYAALRHAPKRPRSVSAK